MPVLANDQNASSDGHSGRGRHSVDVTGHRGFSGAAPENTMAAFRAVIEAGCDMIELDVHLSRDREVVVIHDDTLERTTNGNGNAADRTFAELRRLDAGARFDPRFAGERIPSLAEVLTLARDRVVVNIELKKGGHLPYAMTELADLALREVEKNAMEEQVIFSSFDPAAVDRIREKNKVLPVALICNKSWITPEEAGKGRVYPMLNCHASVLNGNNLRRAHETGIRVHVWTLDAPAEMARFIALGVDGIITNHPDRLIHLLHQRESNIGQEIIGGRHE